MILTMFSKLFIFGVIFNVTYGFSKDVEDSTDKNKITKGCKIANCDVCNVNKKYCISCSVGWGRNNVGTCSACGANCNLCSSDVNVCTQCSTPTPYKLIGEQCKKCELSNCKTCNDDLTKCSICEKSYRLNRDYKCQELCPEEFTYMNSSRACFKFFDLQLTYPEAVILCNGTSTHLPILLDAEIASSLIEFTKINMKYKRIWLALERENATSPLMWKSYNDNLLTPINYTNWYDTPSDEGELHVAMRTYMSPFAGGWQSFGIYDFNVICQYDPHFL